MKIIDSVRRVPFRELFQIILFLRFYLCLNLHGNSVVPQTANFALLFDRRISSAFYGFAVFQRLIFFSFISC